MASLAKVGRWYFENLHDVVTNEYLDAIVELLKQKEVCSYDYVYSFVRLDKFALPIREALFN